MTPMAYTKLTQSYQHMLDLTQANFLNQLGGPETRGSSPAPAAGAGETAWRIWASPLYLESNRFSAKCYEFDDAREKYTGFSFGLGREREKLSWGLSFHHLRGEYDSEWSDLDTRTTGVVLGGRLHSLTDGNGWWNPRLDLTLSYDFSDIDQRAMSFDGAWKYSRPEARLFRAGLDLANDLPLTGRLTLTPHLGVDYTRIRQSGYQEHGGSDYLLRVEKNTYESLRPEAGLELTAALAGGLSLSARGACRYETMDKRSSFDTEIAGLDIPRFNSTGEDLDRSSYLLGAGLKYQAASGLIVGLDFDYHLADQYRAPQFSGSLSYSF